MKSLNHLTSFVVKPRLVISRSINLIIIIIITATIIIILIIIIIIIITATITITITNDNYVCRVVRNAMERCPC